MRNSWLRECKICWLSLIFAPVLAFGVPNPPVLSCDGVGCVNTEVPQNRDAPYDLYGTDSSNRGPIPFAVNWPNPPVIDRTINVPADMSLSSAASIPNARINVAAGSYGHLDIRQNDQHWNLADDAQLAMISIGRINGRSRPQRIVIEGGSLDAISSEVYLTGDDFLIDNVNWRYQAMIIGSGRGDQPFQRVAIVRSTLTGWSSTLLLNNGAENNAAYNTDFIFAGNHFAGGMNPATSDGIGIEFGLRLMATDRVILVDNRGRNGIEGLAWKNAYRLQDGVRNVWFRRNMTEYGDAIRMIVGPMPEQRIGDVWIYDHRSYIPQNTNGDQQGFFSVRLNASESNYFGTLTVDGNLGYDYRQTDVDGRSPGRWSWQALPGDLIGSSIEFPYQSPPTLNQWPAAGGRPPGADH